MKTKCYSVRLSELIRISEKAYKATAFDGSSAIIPASQVFGVDFDVQKSDAYWISTWILGQKEIQYSPKKEAWFDENRNQLPSYKIEKYKAPKEAPIDSNEIKELQK